MCGIAGIFDLRGERRIDARALKRMTDALAHRGPDGEGFFEAPGVGLGHRRLAIIDREGGAQPFIASDGASGLAFNGEIYNHRELRPQLEDCGIRFKTRSDTEALAEGLLADGAAFVDQLRGMFAFAYYNARERELILTRDRFGEKPLYYATTRDGFLIFASEIGAIVASGLVETAHDADAIRDYFFCGYVPDPKTIYRGVFKLPPATILVAGRGREPDIHRYWRAEFRPDHSLTEKNAAARLLELFDDAVAAQLESDVPLGAFLSGGVDSTSVVASMAQKIDHVSTSTIGFDHAKFDERDYASEIARRYETYHAEETVGLDASALIDKVAAVYGEPFADPSALPTLEVSRIARNRVTVALSGDGGDEIFGGYRRYAFFNAEERARRLAPLFVRRATFGLAGALYPKLDWAPRPMRLKTTLQALGENSTGAYARAVSAILPDRLAMMLSAEFKRAREECVVVRNIADKPGRLDPVSLAQMIDIESWLPGRMLVKIDRAAMAHGLEVRAPFLDHRLAEWAFTLPASLKLGPKGGKHILKCAQAARIGDNIAFRPKQGFSPPVAAWLRDVKGPLARLDESGLWRQSGVIDNRAIEQMRKRHLAGASDYSQELWSLIMFDAFLRHEKQKDFSASAAPACERISA